MERFGAVWIDWLDKFRRMGGSACKGLCTLKGGPSTHRKGPRRATCEASFLLL